MNKKVKAFFNIILLVITIGAYIYSIVGAIQCFSGGYYGLFAWYLVLVTFWTIYFYFIARNIRRAIKKIEASKKNEE